MKIQYRYPRTEPLVKVRNIKLLSLAVLLHISKQQRLQLIYPLVVGVLYLFSKLCYFVWLFWELQFQQSVIHNTLDIAGHLTESRCLENKLSETQLPQIGRLLLICIHFSICREHFHFPTTWGKRGEPANSASSAKSEFWYYFEYFEFDCSDLKFPFERELRYEYNY